LAFFGVRIMNHVYSRPTSILTVEDDDLIRASIRAYLEDHDYVVHEAADGQRGLQAFEELDLDLILLDLRLPKIDGLELLRHITTDAPQTPVIIISGMGTIDDVVEALRCGAWDYLTKPIFDLDLLHHAITSALNQAELLRKNQLYQEHLEQEVKRRTAELNQAQKLEAIGTLAGGIAHDFNNVLSAILGYTELCMLQAEDNHQLSDNLKQIKIGAERASDLIRQILTFSRKQADTAQPLAMAPVIKETLKLLRASLPSTVNLHQQITASAAQVCATPTDIHQLLMNLCTNAFHALPAEKGSIEVFLAPVDVPAGRFPDLAPGRYLRLTVVDDGVGMDHATVAKIFDPFFTTKEEGKGTGLGMSVVHGIVSAKGGKIDVNSTPGQGTIVHVYLPAAQHIVHTAMPPASDIPHGHGKILFVDDEEALARLGQRILSHLGYTVQPCTDSLQALELFKSDPEGFDLIITDQTMPNLTGTDLITAIRDLKPNQAVLLCTGYSSLLDQAMLQRLALDGFLKKPLSIHGLADAVDRAIRHQSAAPTADPTP
jgi:signal transduction histidine kinase